MVAFAGLPNNRIAFVSGQAPVTGAPPTSTQPTQMTGAVGTPDIIDGTPVRVAGLILASALGIWGLRLAGFKFSVTAGTR